MMDDPDSEGNDIEALSWHCENGDHDGCRGELPAHLGEACSCWCHRRKKPYQAARLREYGNLAAITGGVQHGKKQDNARGVHATA